MSGARADAIQAKTQFMQSVGYIPKRPEQIEQRIEQNPGEIIDVKCTPEETAILAQASRILHENDAPQPKLH